MACCKLVSEAITASPEGTKTAVACLISLRDDFKIIQTSLSCCHVVVFPPCIPKNNNLGGLSVNTINP